MRASTVSRWRAAGEIVLGVPAVLAVVLPVIGAFTDFRVLGDKFDSGQAALCVLGLIAGYLIVLSRAVGKVDVVHDDVVKLVDAEARERRLSGTEYGGLVGVHPEFPTGLFKRYITEARREITILQTWIPDFRLKFKDQVQAALLRGVKVRILLLTPTSPVAGLRERSLGPFQQPNVRNSVGNNLEALTEIWEALPPSARENLEVRLYDTLPSVAVYRADQHYLVSSFLHERRAVMCVQSEIWGDDTMMGQEAREEFKAIWTKSELSVAVDFPDGWKTQIDPPQP